MVEFVLFAFVLYDSSPHTLCFDHVHFENAHVLQMVVHRQNSKVCLKPRFRGLHCDVCSFLHFLIKLVGEALHGYSLAINEGEVFSFAEQMPQVEAEGVFRWDGMVKCVKLSFAEPRHKAPDPLPVHPGAPESIEGSSSQIEGRIEHVALLFSLSALLNNPVKLHLPTSQPPKAFMRYNICLPDGSEALFIFDSVSQIGVEVGLQSEQA